MNSYIEHQLYYENVKANMKNVEGMKTGMIYLQLNTYVNNLENVREQWLQR